MDEVNLNDPLNWYISDAMDEYIGHVDSGAAKKMIAQIERTRNFCKPSKMLPIISRQQATKIAQLLPAADGGQTAKIATVQ